MPSLHSAVILGVGAGERQLGYVHPRMGRNHGGFKTRLFCERKVWRFTLTGLEGFTRGQLYERGTMFWMAPQCAAPVPCQPCHDIRAT